MKVLLLGPGDPSLESALRETGDQVEVLGDALSSSLVDEIGCDFVVSYRYRHILKPDVLKLFPDRAINLHGSLLPWNRGADPNFWSFFDDTPKGYSIHLMDAGVDTGLLLAQTEVRFVDGETLKTTYETLQSGLMNLFCDSWPLIREGKLRAIPQAKGGSFHRKRDMEKHRGLLDKWGWDLPVSLLVDYGRRCRMAEQEKRNIR